MSGDYKPVFGPAQARYGPQVCLSFQSMDKTVDEAIERLLDIVAANLLEMMTKDARLPGNNRPKELSDASGVGKGTIQRILKGSAKKDDDPARNAARIDTLMKLAWYFEQPLLRFFVAKDRMSRVFDAPDALIEGVSEAPSLDLKRPRRRSPT